MAYDLAVINGRIVTDTESFYANIYVKDGKIAAVTSPEDILCAHETIDASGLTIMPGFIDTHVHSRDGRNGAHYKEDFFHSTMAAAAGGFTTIFEMPNCNPSIYNADRLHELIECVTPKAHVDFCVWGLCLGDLNADALKELSDSGVCGFKFFWGYAIDSKNYQLIYNFKSDMPDVIPPIDRGEILRLFENVQKTGKLLAIHAEDFDIVKSATEKVLKSNNRSYSALLASRPKVSELSIIESAITYAKYTGTRLHILHLNVSEGLDTIRRAQNEGYPITVETCPHYLALSSEDGERLGARMKIYPIVREKCHQEPLWEGLRDGTISHVCSDHSPHTIEEKSKELFDAPSGMAGIETMSLIMLDGVNRGKISENRMVSALSTNPAKLFGLYPKKGAIRAGADADLVLVDMNREYVFDQNDMHSKVKLSAYDGMNFTGKPVRTILRGRTVCLNDEIVSAPFGRFLAL